MEMIEAMAFRVAYWSPLCVFVLVSTVVYVRYERIERMLTRVDFSEIVMSENIE